MSRVWIVSAARADLRAIRDTIIEHNPSAAVTYLAGLNTAFQHLSAWPQSGRLREEFRPGLRSHVYREHLISYKPTSSGVVVLRVLHGRRDLERIFRQTLERRP